MIYFILILIIFLLLYHDVKKISNFCDNPYKLISVIGSKGSGKSLFTSHLLNTKFKNCHVYSNMEIGEPLQEDYYNYNYPADSVIVIDEAGLIHNNRDFKSFPAAAVQFFKMQRKNRLHVILTSQTPDFDLKIRDLVDYTYIFFNLGNSVPFIFGRCYKNTIIPIKTEDGTTKLMLDYQRIRSKNVILNIPETVRNGEKLGYKTEQIIKRVNQDNKLYK